MVSIILKHKGLWWLKREPQHRARLGMFSKMNDGILYKYNHDALHWVWLRSSTDWSCKARDNFDEHATSPTRPTKSQKKVFAGWRPAIAFLDLFLFNSLLRLTSFLSQNKNYCATSSAKQKPIVGIDIGRFFNIFSNQVSSWLRFCSLLAYSSFQVSIQTRRE